MTFEEFSKIFQKKNSFEKYWNYFLSVAVIAVGLFVFYLLLFTDWYAIKTITTKNIAPLWLIYCLGIMFVSLGLYGFWRIPKSYEITIIKSSIPIDKKDQIVNQILTDFKLIELENDEQYRQFRYVGRFWNSFDIFIFYDTKNIYLNAQQIDFGNDGGFIDFGTSKRVTIKIKNKILTYLESKQF